MTTQHDDLTYLSPMGRFLVCALIAALVAFMVALLVSMVFLVVSGTGMGWAAFGVVMAIAGTVLTIIFYIISA